VSAPWWESEALAWDTETTGLNVQTDRVVTVAMVSLGAGKPTRKSFLINPGVEIPEAAARIHGVTTAIAREDGVAPGGALDETARTLATVLSKGIPVIGMNLCYDLSLFHFDCLRNGVDTLSKRLGGHDQIRPIVDVYCLDKQFSRRKGSRKLGDICAFYGVKHHGAHDSGYDALASAMAAAAIARKYPKIAAMSLDELHDAQVRWKHEQNVSYQTYRREDLGDRDFTADMGWPLYDEVLKAGAL